MKIQTVEENTIVKLGKYYLVKCVEMKNETGNTYTIPIIGELHKDAQFDLNLMHYHIDGRFANRRDYFSQSVDAYGKTNHVVHSAPYEDGYKINRILYLKLKCKRLTTGLRLPPREVWQHGEWGRHVYWKWYDSMIGKSCKGKKCPHLGHTMHEENGQLVCPLHNLVGDIKTEMIIEP